MFDFLERPFQPPGVVFRGAGPGRCGSAGRTWVPGSRESGPVRQERRPPPTTPGRRATNPPVAGRVWCGEASTPGRPHPVRLPPHHPTRPVPVAPAAVPGPGHVEEAAHADQLGPATDGAGARAAEPHPGPAPRGGPARAGGGRPHPPRRPALRRGPPRRPPRRRGRARRPRPPRAGPATPHHERLVLLCTVAPELDEWAAYFAAGAGKRAAAEAGIPRVVSARQADDLLRAAEQFVTVVETSLGLAHQPELDGLAA